MIVFFSLSKFSDSWTCEIQDYGGETRLIIRHDFGSSNVVQVNSGGLVDMLDRAGWLPWPTEEDWRKAKESLTREPGSKPEEPGR